MTQFEVSLIQLMRNSYPSLVTRAPHELHRELTESMTIFARHLGGQLALYRTYFGDQALQVMWKQLIAEMNRSIKMTDKLSQDLEHMLDNPGKPN